MTQKLSFPPEWLKRLLTTPTAELNRWQYAIRFFLELCRHGARQLRQDRASQMAAALSYRTIFGLIPVIIIAILLFRAVGGAEEFSTMVNDMLTAAQLDQVASPDEGKTLAVWAREVVTSISENINARTIGVIGACVLIWAAIGLLTTIERCFNQICQAAEHRSLMRRIPLYWTTLTLGLILLYSSFHFQGRLVQVIQTAGWGDSLASTIGFATAFAATWLFLLLIYVLMPNTRVHRAAAGVGSLVAAVLWVAATHAFGEYIAWSFRKESSAFAILYSSLGLIPLFMLWVYFLWLVVLYGLEITSMFQVVGGRMQQKMTARVEAPPLTDPASVIPLMNVVAERFERGLTTDRDLIVDETRLNQRAVDLLLAALAEEGVLHPVELGGETSYALARPASGISTVDLLRVGQRLTEANWPQDSQAWNWVRRFREAQLDLTVHRPLAEL